MELPLLLTIDSLLLLFIILLKKEGTIPIKIAYICQNKKQKYVRYRTDT